MSGFGGFHGSEQTSLPWLTWLLSACWKSQSLHLAGLTTHSSPQPRAETLQLSTQIVSTRSPAGACLACCSSKSPSQHQGRSLALGLLVCLLAWASFEHHYEDTCFSSPNPHPAQRAEATGSLLAGESAKGHWSLETLPPRLSVSHHVNHPNKPAR